MQLIIHVDTNILGDQETFKSIKTTYRHVDPPIDLHSEDYISSIDISINPVSIFIDREVYFT